MKNLPIQGGKLGNKQSLGGGLMRVHDYFPSGRFKVTGTEEEIGLEPPGLTLGVEL